ncbi:MAG: hypothetical protein M1830_001469 [Pleopsidium flavum]|nr:MAG: hypothetical protein M1830_001469 [Pleopsidium flavum]
MHFTVIVIAFLLPATPLALASAAVNDFTSPVSGSNVARSNDAQYDESRAPKFFHTTIVGDDGKDASEQLKIMHYYHDPNSRKRATSRLIDWCPSSMIALASTCRREEDAQAWAIVCQNQQGGPPFHMDLGTCYDHEVCVHTRTSGVANRPLRAYCVSKEDFVQIAQAAAERAGVHPPAEVAQHVAGGVAVEAVVTAPDGKTLLPVKGLSIDASGANNAALPGGHQGCSGCSTIGLDPVPPGTKEVHSQVAMEGIASGLLYLLSVGAISAT